MEDSGVGMPKGAASASVSSLASALSSMDASRLESEMRWLRNRGDRKVVLWFQLKRSMDVARHGTRVILLTGALGEGE